jgi:hypothetical protein
LIINENVFMLPKLTTIKMSLERGVWRRIVQRPKYRDAQGAIKGHLTVRRLLEIGKGKNRRQ